MTCQAYQAHVDHEKAAKPVGTLAGIGSNWPAIIVRVAAAFGVICLAMLPIEMRSTLLILRSGPGLGLRLLARH